MCPVECNHMDAAPTWSLTSSDIEVGLPLPLSKRLWYKYYIESKWIHVVLYGATWLGLILYDTLNIYSMVNRWLLCLLRYYVHLCNDLCSSNNLRTGCIGTMLMEPEKKWLTEEDRDFRQTWHCDSPAAGDRQDIRTWKYEIKQDWKESKTVFMTAPKQGPRDWRRCCAD